MMSFMSPRIGLLAPLLGLVLLLAGDAIARSPSASPVPSATAAPPTTAPVVDEPADPAAYPSPAAVPASEPTTALATATVTPVTVSPTTTAPASPSILVHPRAGLMMALPAGFREKTQPAWSPVSLYVHDARETIFQSNMNLVLQYHEGTLEDFVTRSLAKPAADSVRERHRAADATVGGVTAAVLESTFIERSITLKSRQVLLPRENLIYVFTGTAIIDRFPAFEPSFTALLDSVKLIPRASYPPRLGALFTDPTGRFALQPPEGFSAPPAGSEGHGLLLGPWEGGDWVRLHAVTVPLSVPDVPQKFKQFFVDRGWAHQTHLTPEFPVTGSFLRLHRKSAVLMQLEDRHFSPPLARLALFLPVGSDHALKIYYQLPLPAFSAYHEVLEKSLRSLVPRNIPVQAPPPK